MTSNNLNSERRKQLKLGKLGTNEPRCGTCGESDWRCFEEHHPAKRTNDSRTVPLCANDHKRVTDAQNDHPRTLPGADSLLAAAGELCLGVADISRLVIARLDEWGPALVSLAESNGEPLLLVIGNFMLGHSPMLSKLVEMLDDYGTRLIERANALAPSTEGAAS